MNNGKVDTQKYYQTIGTGEGGYGRYYLYSATNVRLQELSLSYTLPKKWLNNVANVTFWACRTQPVDDLLQSTV